MPSSSDIDTPSHTLQYSICFIVILVVIFTNLSLPTINPHCRLIHQQWGCAFTAFSKDSIISVNLPISSKTLAITTNILKNSPSTPQAISNAFMDNSQTVNTFSICHNLGNEKYAVLYATISYL